MICQNLQLAASKIRIRIAAVRRISLPSCYATHDGYPQSCVLRASRLALGMTQTRRAYIRVTDDELSHQKA
jgi:hypothetical protein